MTDLQPSAAGVIVNYTEKASVLTALASARVAQLLSSVVVSANHERRFDEVTDATNLPSLTTVERAQAALLARGIEILRVDANEIALAKRVRSHLMDANVSVQLGSRPNVRFVVRAQSSDFPGAGAKQLYEKVREEIAASARAQGFDEVAQQPREVRDPGDASRVLDVWYELTYAKPVSDAGAWLEDIRWAMSISKCIGS